jgi:hypothetical protein
LTAITPGSGVTRIVRSTGDGTLFVIDMANGNDNVQVTPAAHGSATVSSNLGNGTFTTYQYDPAGQLQHLINFAPDNTINSRFDYTYNALGLRSTMTTLAEG